MNYRHCFPFLVEDDDDFALLLGRAFVKAGVPAGNIRRYSDGETALAHLTSIDVIRPSALVVDVELPGMTGLSVLERVRSFERLTDLPAFVLSGRDDNHFIAAAHELGARGYWRKPLGNGTLQGIVGGILGSLNGGGTAMPAGNLLERR
jgi:DNA-binding response OmpR family regulator